MENKKGFFWERHPKVESYFLDYLHYFSVKNGFLEDFGRRLIRHTSSGILDWVDHLLLRDSKEVRRQLDDLGFKRKPDSESPAFFHPGVSLPAVVLIESVSSGDEPGVALRVESIEDFCGANGPAMDIEAPAFSPCRRGCVSIQNGAGLWVIERRGTGEFKPVIPEASYFQEYGQAVASWSGRPRDGEDEDALFGEMDRLIGVLVSTFGAGQAAHIVCSCERDYWLAQNRAGRVQKKRQDALGVGWANHDHYTFRSSRRNFSRLINLFLKLGFHKRERFYAGEEAGWGAQVMEHSIAGLVLFLDVDLAPEEVDFDFSTRDLEERESLGTVGLWCALHGDSILKAGMHHMAARFDFERLIEDIAKQDIRFMPPFSYFPYLKQAFSVSELWQVAPSRVRKLVQEKHIGVEQAEKFLGRGTIGSHLENIERREGYKGFNRKNVSAIIRDTDPRKEESTS
jgi:hypothetical protein